MSWNPNVYIQKEELSEIKTEKKKYTVTMVLVNQNEDSRFKSYFPGKTGRF